MGIQYPQSPYSLLFRGETPASSIDPKATETMLNGKLSEIQKKSGAQGSPHGGVIPKSVWAYGRKKFFAPVVIALSILSGVTGVNMMRASTGDDNTTQKRDFTTMSQSWNALTTYDHSFFNRGVQQFNEDAIRIIQDHSYVAKKEVLASWKNPTETATDFLAFMSQSLGKLGRTPTTARFERSMNLGGVSDFDNISIQNDFVKSHPSLKDLNEGEQRELASTLQEAYKKNQQQLHVQIFSDLISQAMVKNMGVYVLDYKGDNSFDVKDMERLLEVLVNQHPVYKDWSAESKQAFLKEGIPLMKETVEQGNASSFGWGFLGFVLLAAGGATGLGRIFANYRDSDSSLSAYKHALKSPLMLANRFRHPYVKLKLLNPDEAARFARVTASVTTYAQKIEALIQQAASQNPGMEKQLQQLVPEQTSQLPGTSAVLQYYMNRVLSEVEAKTLRQKTLKGMIEVSPLEIAQRLELLVKGAYDTNNFLEFMLPEETSAIQALKKKKDVSYPEASQVIHHEIRKARVILTSQTMSYILAKEEYKQAMLELQATKEKLSPLLNTETLEADLQLLDMQLDLDRTTATRERAEQKLEGSRIAIQRANQLLKNLFDYKIHLEESVKAQMFERADGEMKSIDGISKTISIRDLPTVTREMAVQVAAEKALSSMKAKEIRAQLKVQLQAEKMQPEKNPPPQKQAG